MQEIDIQDLLKKHAEGTISPAEKELLENWYLQWEVKPKGLTEERMADITAEIYSRLPQPNKSVPLWKRVVAAAAIATFIFGAGLFYFSKDTKQVDSSQLVIQEDVTPGVWGATLTLASGKKIRLADASSGELANEAGVSITKSANGQLIYNIKGSEREPNKMNTLSTAKGETYQVRLPDGSLVYLNAASSLTYSASLIQRGKRTVRLRGEGYFQVAKDRSHPFIVESNGQQVEVLGTHFNISAYEHEPDTKTTLEEGSVKVITANANKTLKPNQQAILYKNSIQIKDVDAEYALAWKNGFFMFNDENLESIMYKVANWYDVEVTFSDPSLKTETFIGTISRFEKISEVFRMLERTDVASFRLEGKKVIISNKK